MRLHRALAACVSAALIVTACGGDDEPGAAPDEPADEPADASADEPADALADEPADAPADAPADEPAGDGPVSTLSPEIPEEYLAGIAPVDVTGEWLPPYPDRRIPDGGVDDAVGKTPPQLVGLDRSGDPITIDPATAGPAMLVFLAHWCSHCNNEVPRINELRDDGAFPDELNIIGILTGSNPQAPNWPPTDWIVDMDWTYPTFVDGIDLEIESFVAYEAYGVGGFPFVVLLDEDGTVAYRWSGESGPGEITDAISTHLGL